MTDKHDKLVEMALASGFTLWDGGIYSHKNTAPGNLAAFAAAHVNSLCADVDPFVFEEYPYHYEAMGCGLEDRNITDRYEAMAYGWERAMERAAEAIPDDLYPASTVASLTAQRNAALARVAELEKDAEKWRALMAIGRIRPLGAAGCKSLDEQGDYAHIGLELWTTFSGYDNPKLAHVAAHEKESFAAWFEVFMGKAVRLYRAALAARSGT